MTEPLFDPAPFATPLLIDPEAPIDPALSLPDPEAKFARPSPLVTSRQPELWPPNEDWPTAHVAFMKWADKNGWSALRSYAKGYKPGRSKGTWALLEIVSVWCRQDGRPNVVASWERSPESVNPSWKATTVSFRAGANVRAYGHRDGKAVMVAP